MHKNYMRIDIHSWETKRMLETRRVGDLIGLMEILEDFNEPLDIARLDDQLDEERVTLLNLLQDAESLGLIEVDNGDVFVTSLGREFLKADVEKRRDIVRERMLHIEPFKTLLHELQKLQDKSVEKEWLQNFIHNYFPSDNEKRTFDIIIGWGRYARILNYDSDSDEIRFR